MGHTIFTKAPFLTTLINHPVTKNRKFTHKLKLKMNSKVNFLFFCMIFVGNFALAQKKAEKLLFTKDFYRLKNTPEKALKINTVLLYNNKKIIAPAEKAVGYSPFINFSPISYSLINPGFYTQHFGFFCKKELQMGKITKVPFKFRLGSVQQCDWMEGKPNAIKPN
jgi:hypothetical protein